MQLLNTEEMLRKDIKSVGRFKHFKISLTANPQLEYPRKLFQEVFLLELENQSVVRPDMVLMYNPKGMWRVAASRRTKLLLHSGVGDGRRLTTHHRAEPARERPLDFRIVQVPGVPVDALEGVNPKREARRWNLLS